MGLSFMFSADLMIKSSFGRECFDFGRRRDDRSTLANLIIPALDAGVICQLKPDKGCTPHPTCAMSAMVYSSPATNA
jgi:hypothetical protein